MMVERLGLRYGPDANAGTDPTRRSTSSTWPRNDEASVDTGLMLSLRDRQRANAGPEDSMDAERAVVLNESSCAGRAAAGYAAGS